MLANVLLKVLENVHQHYWLLSDGEYPFASFFLPSWPLRESSSIATVQMKYELDLIVPLCNVTALV